ncbi:MAG TPA: ATP-binding protein [Thermodesulfobacteriota bacterium]|nr:ATP-binding protein [Thermodesulfobacteriota bacterium]
MKTISPSLNLNLVQKYFRVIVFVLILFFVAVSLNSLIRAIGWINRPFPGFLLYENSLVAEVSLSSWSGYRSGLIKYYDKVITIDGNTLPPHQIYSVVSDKPIGTLINYTVSRNDKIINLSIPNMRFGLGDFFLIFGVVYFVGLVIFVTGVLVYLSKPELTSSKFFFTFCLSMSIWFISIFDAQSTYSLGSIPFIGWIFTPAFAISLAFIFPSRKKFFRDSPTAMLASFLPSVAILALHLGYFDSQSVWKGVDIATWFYVLASTLIFVAFTTISYIKPDFSLEKERARVILLGAFVGFLIPALCAFVVTSLGISNLNNLALLVLFFPISIAYAIVKHKLFDIDAIIKRTLVYITLTAVVVGILAFAVIIFNIDFGTYRDWNQTAFFVILLSILLVIVINPLKNQIQNFVEAVFFKGVYDYQKTIEEMSFAMVSLLNIDEISRKIINTIEGTIFSSPVFIVLVNQNSGNYQIHAKSRSVNKVNIPSLKQDSDLIRLLNTYGEEIFKEDLTADERYSTHKDKLMKIFADFDAALFIPLFFKERLIGILSLGEKRNGLPYTSQDIKLLRILTNQSAVAIENAISFKLIEDYARKLEDTNRELQETQIQLVQAEKMSAVGQLAGGVAHEFNNILTGIIGYTNFAMSRTNIEQIRKDLSVVQKASDRAAEIVKKLLSFSRHREEGFQLALIDQVIEDTLILIERSLESEGIRVVRHYGKIPPIKMNVGEMQQVVLNIVINSKHAMPKGGVIAISTELEEDYVRVDFSDTGVGIPKENLPKIFEPFFTTKGSLGSGSVPGTGLGLSVTYAIVERHGGRIDVSSEVGKGTTFTIKIPNIQHLSRTDVSGLLPEENKSAVVRSKKKGNILVVDDEKFICDIFKESLSEIDHNVVTVNSGEDAIELVQKNHFDIVFLDPTMPGKSGLDIFEEIRVLDPDSFVVIISGRMEESLSGQLINAGAFSFIRKPFTLDQIQHTVSRILEGE